MKARSASDGFRDGQHSAAGARAEAVGDLEARRGDVVAFRGTPRPLARPRPLGIRRPPRPGSTPRRSRRRSSRSTFVGATAFAASCCAGGRRRRHRSTVPKPGMSAASHAAVIRRSARAAGERRQPCGAGVLSSDTSRAWVCMPRRRGNPISGAYIRRGRLNAATRRRRRPCSSAAATGARSWCAGASVTKSASSSWIDALCTFQRARRRASTRVPPCNVRARWIGRRVQHRLLEFRNRRARPGGPVACNQFETTRTTAQRAGRVLCGQRRRRRHSRGPYEGRQPLGRALAGRGARDVAVVVLRAAQRPAAPRSSEVGDAGAYRVLDLKEACASTSETSPRKRASPWRSATPRLVARMHGHSVVIKLARAYANA